MSVNPNYRTLSVFTGASVIDMQIVDRLKSVGYGERSPSGNGIKFWTRATLPPKASHKAFIVNGADAIEAYQQWRFL